jgi:2-methylcitrate dehydratase PrpD
VTEMKDLANDYAAPALQLKYEDLGAETIDATLDALYDTLAVALGGLNAPGIPEVRRALSRWGGGSSSIWGGYGTAPAPFAALINAGALHALDYDDTDDAVPLHANSVFLPALIADMEERDADVDGREFVTTVAAGIDGAMRIGRAGGPKGSRGWNYSVISSGFGAVLGIARSRSWTLETTVNALGHQLAQTSGSLQSIIDGALAKRFQPAMVSKDVLVGVALTEAGIDAARNVFEGRAGFINLYQDGKLDAETLVKGAEHASLVPALSLKPYPACRFTHAPIDIALQMRDRGVTMDDVDTILYSVSGQAVNMVGRDFDPSSANVVDAQFSIAYTISVALETGSVLIGDFDPETFRNSRAGRFARDRVRVEANADIPFLGMAPVGVTVRFKNGREETFNTTSISGSPEKRMTEAQLKAKAVDCLARSGAAVTAEELWSTVRDLKDGAPLKNLLELLRRPGTQA